MGRVRGEEQKAASEHRRSAAARLPLRLVVLVVGGENRGWSQQGEVRTLEMQRGSKC